VGRRIRLRTFAGKRHSCVTGRALARKSAVIHFPLGPICHAGVARITSLGRAEQLYVVASHDVGALRRILLGMASGTRRCGNRRSAVVHGSAGKRRRTLVANVALRTPNRNMGGVHGLARAANLVAGIASSSHIRRMNKVRSSPSGKAPVRVTGVTFGRILPASMG
jgi:hypothetical protein